MKEEKIKKVCDNCSNHLKEDGLKFKLIIMNLVINPLNFCQKECRDIFIKTKMNNIKRTPPKAQWLNEDEQYKRTPTSQWM
jgi:hypothetical protein